MAEANPLLAQFAGGRQIGQSAPMQVTQGQGMAPGQVAQYLQGNALNIGQRLDGRANNMVESDVASDVRARERFQERMDQQVYADNNAMKRAEMDLEGRKSIADAQNQTNILLAEKNIASREGMFNQELLENARQFDDRQAWMKEAKRLDLDEAEAVRYWEQTEREKDRTLSRETTDKKIESQEKTTFAQIDAQLKIAGMEDKTRNRIADMANVIDQAKIGIMQDEVKIKSDQLEINKEISLMELEENRRQFNENLEKGYAQIDAEMAKASAADKRMLEVAKMQLDGAKYNVDKSYELKMLERQDEANRAANIQPVVDDMMAKVLAWKSGGIQQEQEKLEAAFIMSNASRIQGIDITTLYKPNGNPDPVAIAKAKTAFYSNPANKDLRDSMNQFVSSGIQATTTQMNELERIAFTYKGKYAMPTSPPGNAITAPQQGGSGGFTPQLPPGFKGMR